LPSESVADPVSANGVRMGIDLLAGAVTVGLWLVVVTCWNPSRVSVFAPLT
jgi:hypothetical protein